MPYVAFFSALVMASALSFSGVPGMLQERFAFRLVANTTFLVLAYIIALCASVFAISLLYIFSHGIEYVNWPKLNPPVEAIFYEGPGFRSTQHGRGKEFRWVPLPQWARSGLVRPVHKASVPVLHRLEEIEMGTGVGSKKRVD